MVEAINNEEAEAAFKFPILKFFRFDHLPQNLRDVSEPFGVLAFQIAMTKTENYAEKAACLRKLLEAKDCAVRAAL